MADTFAPAVRSRIMRAIKGSDTKPELALRAELDAMGLPGETHAQWFDRQSRRLPGRPDVVFASARLAVFVHGCFWHLCPRHYKAPAGRGWRLKMDANRRRDVRVRRQLRRLGWRTMVVWEHEEPFRAAVRVANRVDALRVRRERAAAGPIATVGCR